MGASASMPKRRLRKAVSCPFVRRKKDDNADDFTSRTVEATSSPFYFNNRGANATLPSAEEQIRLRRRTQSLPSTGEFSSCHVMINRERLRLGKKPLYRCVELDSIAQKRAKKMARSQKLNENPIHTETASENVQKGHSIRIIQQLTMGGVCSSQLDNILSDRFTTFGIGCATGDDGMIYMSQVFQTTSPTT